VAASRAPAVVVVAGVRRRFRMAARRYVGDLPDLGRVADPVTAGWDEGTPDCVTPRQAAIALVIVIAAWLFAAMCCGLSL
jgi:hypothetical protein